MPRCKEAASPRNTRSIFSFSAGTFPLGSLQDLNAADNRQRLFLALCRMDDPDDRKNAEHQGKDPEETLVSTLDNTLQIITTMHRTSPWFA